LMASHAEARREFAAGFFVSTGLPIRPVPSLNWSVRSKDYRCRSSD
jgi:hypothetical protein